MKGKIMNLMIITASVLMFDLVLTSASNSIHCLPPDLEEELYEFPETDTVQENHYAKYAQDIDPDTYFDDYEEIERWMDQITNAQPYNPLIEETYLQ